MSIILVIATVVIAAIYWLQIGFSNIPISQPHDLLKKGTLTELKVKLRRNPINPYQDLYAVGLLVPKSRKGGSFDTCRLSKGECAIGAEIRIRITDDNSKALVLDKTSITTFGGETGLNGEEFWRLALFHFRLALGSYTVTFENLDDDATLIIPAGRVFFDYGSK